MKPHSIRKQGRAFEALLILLKHLTADFNILQGRFVLRYRINDPFLFATAAFTQMLAQPRRSPGLVSQRILRETLDTVLGGVQPRTLLPADEARPSFMLEPSA